MTKARTTIDKIKVYCRYDEIVSVGDFKPHPQNPIIHSTEQVERLAEIFKKNGIRKPITISKLSGYITAGHCRLKAAQLLGLSSYPAEWQEYKDKEAELADLIADNRVAELAEVDEKALLAALDELKDAEAAGFTDEEIESLLKEDKETDSTDTAEAKENLKESFSVPPTSVINGRDGEWLERKRSWKAYGIKSEIGRADNLVFEGSLLVNITDYNQQKEKVEKKLKRKISRAEFEERHLDKTKILPRTSIFDPVLCEILYSWFSAEKDKVVDPFAGGSVRGIVAHELNRQYTGIDLRDEQIKANIDNAAEVLTDKDPPHWIAGDSNVVLDTLDKDFDFCLSCPPYADLEKYSDNPADISNMEYPDFLSVYRSIIKKLYDRLNNDRFVAWVIGEVRGSKGNYYNFIGDTIKAFTDAGFNYYNEIIFKTPVASAPKRAPGTFKKTRKICKVHQNVLVFTKGSGTAAAERLGNIEIKVFNK